MKKIISSIAGVLIYCTSFGQTPADWMINVPFNESPSKIEHKTPVEGGENIETTLAVKLEVGFLLVSRIQFPRQLDPHASPAMYAAGKKSLEQKCDILSEEDSTIAGWPGKTFIYLNKKTAEKSAHAIVLINQELYSIIYSAEEGTYSEVEAKKILASVVKQQAGEGTAPTPQVIIHRNTPSDWRINVPFTETPARINHKMTEGGDKVTLMVKRDDEVFQVSRLRFSVRVDPKLTHTIYESNKQTLERIGVVSLAENITIAGWPGRRYIWTGKQDTKKRSHAFVLIGQELYTILYTADTENYSEIKAKEFITSVTKKFAPDGTSQ